MTKSDGDGDDSNNQVGNDRCGGVILSKRFVPRRTRKTSGMYVEAFPILLVAESTINAFVSSYVLPNLFLQHF